MGAEAADSKNVYFRQAAQAAIIDSDLDESKTVGAAWACLLWGREE